LIVYKVFGKISEKSIGCTFFNRSKSYIPFAAKKMR